MPSCSTRRVIADRRQQRTDIEQVDREQPRGGVQAEAVMGTVLSVTVVLVTPVVDIEEMVMVRMTMVGAVDKEEKVMVRMTMVVRTA
jgi:hypothetical protein